MISKKFCSAPWFAVRTRWDGKFTPCCEFLPEKSVFKGRRDYNLKDSSLDEWMSSEYLQYIKKSLDNDQPLPECEICWAKEANGILSSREVINDGVTDNQGKNLENTWVKSFLKSSDYKSYRLLYADVKLNNTCNFSCAMCDPRSSSRIFSRWNNDKESWVVKEVENREPNYFSNIIQTYQSQRGYQHLKDILEQPLIHLKILGGEPLLDKELFNILTVLPQQKKQKISLHFITNGSQNIVAATKSLGDFKSISFSVSLEGVGAVQDYIRSGSEWNLIEQNLLEAKQQGITVSVHHTIQAMSLLGIGSLIEWCKSNSLEISFGILQYPEYLSIAVLPDRIRKIVKTQVKSQEIIDLVDSVPDRSNSFLKFWDYVNWYEQNHDIKLQELFPDLVV